MQDFLDGTTLFCAGSNIRLIMFYKIHNDQTGIDTGKYVMSTTKLMRSLSLSLIIINSLYFPRTINEWNVMPDETVNAGADPGGGVDWVASHPPFSTAQETHTHK